MKLFYYKDPAGNFGDDLNEWIWDPFLGDRLNGAGANMSGIGTLIGPMMKDPGPWIVFGSGAGYGPPPADFGGPRWTIACVRGPLTARLLGLDPSLAVADPAILLRSHPAVPERQDNGRVAFMPHHSIAEQDEWRWAAEAAGIDYIDPRDDAHQSIARIRNAKLLICDAMHGAIVADAIRTPWVAVSSSPETSTFKWLDWSSSLGMRYDPIVMPASSLDDHWRSKGLRYYGRFYRTAAEPETALAHVQADIRAKNQPLSFRQRQVGKVAARTVGGAALRISGATGHKSRFDARARDALAEALRRAAALPGQLSEDRILAEKESILLQKLSELRAATPEA